REPGAGEGHRRGPPVVDGHPEERPDPRRDGEPELAGAARLPEDGQAAGQQSPGRPIPRALDLDRLDEPPGRRDEGHGLERLGQAGLDDGDGGARVERHLEAPGLPVAVTRWRGALDEVRHLLTRGIDDAQVTETRERGVEGVDGETEPDEAARRDADL